jgi:hypothetical protein
MSASEEIRRLVSTLERCALFEAIARVAVRCNPRLSTWPSIFPGRGPASGSSSRTFRPINYIVGPLGSGKTRFAQRLAEAIPTQEALIAHLRERANAAARPLFLMTRSSAILNLAAIGPDEAIFLCPANHSLPTRVAAFPGAPGYEAVATCLASPEARARTAGVIACQRQAV